MKRFTETQIFVSLFTSEWINIELPSFLRSNVFHVYSLNGLVNSKLDKIKFLYKVIDCPPKFSDNFLPWFTIPEISRDRKFEKNKMDSRHTPWPPTITKWNSNEFLRILVWKFFFNNDLFFATWFLTLLNVFLLFSL